MEGGSSKSNRYANLCRCPTQSTRLMVPLFACRDRLGVRGVGPARQMSALSSVTDSVET